MGNKKETPDVNASSTADIAFLLLVFFLISSTMTSDFGLGRMLPQSHLLTRPTRLSSKSATSSPCS